MLLITDGTVTLSVGAAEPASLHAGQSAIFRADEPHSYRNDSDEPAGLVLAVHEPTGGVA